jgi:hypothetical protein
VAGTGWPKKHAGGRKAQLARTHTGRPHRSVKRCRRPPRSGPAERAGVHRLPPKEIWRQIWSNNPQERLNREIRRRTDVVGIFPDRGSLIRLVGAVLAEQNDEWIEGRRYLGLDVLARSRITPVPTTDPTEVTTDNDLQALTA